MRLTKRLLWTVLTYAIAVGCLFWVFHGVQGAALWRSLGQVDWWWLLPAVALDLLVYGVAAWEWQLLLRPVARISLRQTAQALFVGRFANDVLPVHAGYLIRLYLAARWGRTTIACVIPSLLIERLFDSLWLAVSLGLTILFFPLPSSLARAGEVLGSLILAGVVVVSWVVLRRRRGPANRPVPRWFRRKPLRKVWEFIERMVDGLRSIGRSYVVLAALGLSILKLLVQCLAFLALLHSYRFSFSLWVELAVFVIAYVGISMPSTPASVGVFQLFCAMGLRFFGVSPVAASGFGLLAFVVLTAPLALAGFWSVTRTGLTLRQIRREIAQWQPNASVRADRSKSPG